MSTVSDDIKDGLLSTKLSGLDGVQVEGDGNGLVNAGSELWESIANSFTSVKPALIPDLTVKIEVADAYQASALHKHFQEKKVDYSEARGHFKFRVSSREELNLFKSVSRLQSIANSRDSCG